MVTCLVCSLLFWVSQPQERTLEALCGSAELVACYTTSVTLTSIFRYFLHGLVGCPFCRAWYSYDSIGIATDPLLYPPPPCSLAHLSSQQRPRALEGSWEDPRRILGGPWEGTPFLIVEL